MRWNKELAARPGRSVGPTSQPHSGRLKCNVVGEGSGLKETRQYVRRTDMRIKMKKNPPNCPQDWKYQTGKGVDCLPPDMELTWMATRLSAYSLPLQPARLSTAGLQTSASCASPEQMLSLSLSSASSDFFFSSMQS